MYKILISFSMTVTDLKFECDAMLVASCYTYPIRLQLSMLGRQEDGECIHTSSSQGCLAPARNGVKAAEFISMKLTQYIKFKVH